MEALIALAVGLILGLIYAAFTAILTQWAWNGSVAQIFHLTDIGFVQAFWLNFLGNMVFKSSISKSK